MNTGNYRLDYLFNNVKGFQDACNTLLTLADNEELKDNLMEILYRGSYRGFNFCSNLCSHNSPYNDVRRRLSMACMLLYNPDTFEYLVNNGINVFHGVNGNALPSIFTKGLRSYDNLVKDGIDVSTGETWSRKAKGRDFISFTDVFDIASGYSELSSNGINLLSFGAVIGTTPQCIERSNRKFIYSDLPEVGVKGELPLESIKVIGVPSDKVAFARKMAGNNLIVLPMDSINNKLIYADEDWHSIIINEEEVAKFKSRQENKESKQFGIKEIYYLAVTRKLSKMKEAISKFKKVFKPEYLEEEIEEGRNDGRKIK